MRIRAERDDLADVFSRATRAVGVKSALPILQGVLCEATGQMLRVTGTDLEVTARVTTEVDVLDEGSVVIPGRLATEAIRKLPEGAVTLGSENGEVEIAGGGPRFSLRELPVADFPQLAGPGFASSMDADGEELARAIGQVVVAASADAARPILTGVLIEPGEDGFRLAATDSYRLAVRDLPGMMIESSGLVPARGLRELGRTVGSEKVQVGLSDREAWFMSDRGVLSLRMIEGTFPNYRQLLPEDYPNKMTLSKEGLLEALGRASLVAEDHIPVRLKLGEGGVELSVTRQDVGGEIEHIPGEYQGRDPEVSIAFNPRYLVDGVSVVGDDEVEVEVLDEFKPAVIRGAGKRDFLYLLMPVRV